MNKTYELVIVLDPDLKGEEQDKLNTKIKQIFSNAKAEIKSMKDWGKKSLVYPIAKKNEGAFFIYELEAPPESISVIRQKIQLEEKIIRYLLTVGESEKIQSEPVVKKEKAKK